MSAPVDRRRLSASSAERHAELSRLDLGRCACCTVSRKASAGNLELFLEAGSGPREAPKRAYLLARQTWQTVVRKDAFHCRMQVPVGSAGRSTPGTKLQESAVSVRAAVRDIWGHTSDPLWASRRPARRVATFREYATRASSKCQVSVITARLWRHSMRK